MKYSRILAIAALAVAAMLALTAAASATTPTSPSGTTYTGAVNLESEGSVTFHGPMDATCEKSSMEGEVEQHGKGVTIKIKINGVVIIECGPVHVTIKGKGTLTIHPLKPLLNGRFTWSGGKLRFQFTALGLECEYETNETAVGTLTGSESSNATWDVESSSIPRTGGSIFCGSSMEWTGSYVVTTPSVLSIDE